MAANGSVDLNAVFMDIVYADPELVQIEFEQLVSGLVLTSTRTSSVSSPGPVGGPTSQRRRRDALAMDSWIRHPLERVRAPPLTAAAMAALI